MGRPREFDTTEALDAAVGVFWERGYEATSINDLESATGLARSSLYQAFGSKRELYQESLSRYMERQIEPALAAMKAPGAGRAEIVAYLTTIARAFLDDAALAVRGCMVVNSATELGGRDEGVRRVGIEYWQSIASAMTNALQGAATTETGRQTAADKARITAAALIGALVTAHLDPEGAARVCMQLAESID